MLKAEREVWRPVPWTPNKYKVSNMGRAFSIPRVDALGRPVQGGILTLHDRGNGYRYVTIDGRLEAIHRLVLTVFVRPPSYPREQGRHLNDDRNDNRLINLAWGSYFDNVQDRIKNGGYLKKLQCIHEHPYDDLNTWYTKEGWQQCKECHRQRERKRKSMQRISSR